MLFNMKKFLHNIKMYTGKRNNHKLIQNIVLNVQSELIELLDYSNNNLRTFLINSFN